MMATTCPHASELNLPMKGVPIHREECCQCFHTPSAPGGLELCLVCFTGTCPSIENGGEGHNMNHYNVTKHNIYLHITEIPNKKVDNDTNTNTNTTHASPTPSAPTLDSLIRDAVQAETTPPPQLKYTAHCRSCNVELAIDSAINPKLASSVPQAISALSSSSPLYDVAVASTAAEEYGFNTGSFEEKPRACPHSTRLLTLQLEYLQDANRKLQDEAVVTGDKNPKTITHLPNLSNALLSKCTFHTHNGSSMDRNVDGNVNGVCGYTDNLWLCLICGSLGCPRANFDGTGGHGHAVKHQEETGHCVVMKVGTLSADGTADLWCYSCDAPVETSNLGAVLESFNISLDGKVKTSKSIAELQVEQNLTAQSASVFDILNNTNMKYISGPELRGLLNTGNSCYMNSLLQALFACDNGIAKRYRDCINTNHLKSCKNPRPGNCYLCQFTKIANVLQEGTRKASLKRDYLATKRVEASHNTSEHIGHTIGMDDQNSDQNNVQERDDHHDISKKLKTTHGKDEDANEESVYTPMTPAPRHFKRLIAGQNPEFLSSRQQCAYEYYGYLLNTCVRAETALKDQGIGANIEDDFSHYQTTKFTCTVCNGSMYKHAKARDVSLLLPKSIGSPVVDGGVDTSIDNVVDNVSFQECLEQTFGDTVMDDFSCTTCQQKTKAKVRTGLRTFPKILAIVVRRFGHSKPGSWVPVKLDTLIDFSQQSRQLPDGKNVDNDDITSKSITNYTPVLTFDDNEILVSQRGPLLGEKLLPISSSTSTIQNKQAPIEIDEESALNLCMITGIDIERVAYALRQCNNDADRACDWLFSHMDEPLPEEGTNTNEVVDTPQLHGNNDPQYEDGIKKYTLRSFISHKGNSTMSGHYISHVFKDITAVNNLQKRKTENMKNHESYNILDAVEKTIVPADTPGWVCFNDANVFVNENPTLGDAYMYFFERE